jgi:hypothetical protein
VVLLVVGPLEAAQEGEAVAGEARAHVAAAAPRVGAGSAGREHVGVLGEAEEVEPHLARVRPDVRGDDLARGVAVAVGAVVVQAAGQHGQAADPSRPARAQPGHVRGAARRGQRRTGQGGDAGEGAEAQERAAGARAGHASDFPSATRVLPAGR